MNALWRFGRGIFDVLGTFIFGIPLLLIGGALLFSFFTPDENSLKVRDTGDDCSIGERATGALVKITTRKDGVELVEVKCRLYFYEFDTKTELHGASPSCKPKNATRSGIPSDMRMPGETGFTNTRVPICVFFLEEYEIPERASLFPA